MSARIEPVIVDGKPVDMVPPSGGSWTLDADGGLTPNDAATAAGAGLDWPAHTE